MCLTWSPNQLTTFRGVYSTYLKNAKALNLRMLSLSSLVTLPCPCWACEKGRLRANLLTQDLSR